MDLFVNAWCTTADGEKHSTGEFITVPEAEGVELIRNGLCREVDDEQRQNLATQRAEAEQPPKVPAGDPDPPHTGAGDTDPVVVPSRSASKGDWVEFAVLQGWEQADADAMTKQELITHLVGE